MKTIGLIGGMSWESTVTYYQHVNRRVAERLGGLHSARLVLVSVDFAEIEALMREERWDELGGRLAGAALTLERAGAGLVVLCTNTLHKVSAAITAAIRVPFVDVVDVTAAAIRAGGARKVGLLGTRFTMEQAFYRERLAAGGVETLVPPERDRARLHRIIFEELVRGRVEDASRVECERVIDALARDGAEGVVLGCTELSMLIERAPVPLFDTTELHAHAAADLALAGD